MAKAMKATKNSVRNTARRTRAAARKVQVTLGDLIAAAFDTVGNEVKDVARLLSSRELHATNGKRIVLVQ